MLRFGPPDVVRLAEKADVKGLLRVLSREKDASLRAAAAQALAELAPAEALETLVAALGDPSPEVRQAAVGALAALGGEAVVEPLIGVANDADEGVAQEALRALGALGDARAVESLLALAEGERPYLRELAAASLAALGEPAMEALARLLLSADEAERERGRALFGRAGEAALPFLQRLLAADNRDTRWRAVEAVARVEGEPALAILVEALGDTDYFVREAAQEAVVARGEDALPLLCESLSRGNVTAQRGAIAALERIGSPLAFEPLLKMLEPEAAAVRREAMQALAAVGGVRAIAPLSAFLQDIDLFVRRIVVESLAKAHAPETKELLLTAMMDSDEKVRRTAAEALRALGWQPDEGEAGARYWASQKRWERCAQIGAAAVPVLLKHLVAATVSEQRIIRGVIERLGDVALPPLLEALRAPELALRVEAAGLLGRLGDEAVLEPLIQALQDPERRVREAAALALGEVGEPTAIPALLERLGDLERQVQQAAAQALAALGGDDPAEMRERLEHADWRVRRGAALALGYSSGAEAVGLLLPCLGDAEANVRQAATEALVRLGASAVIPLLGLLTVEDVEKRHTAISILAQIKDRRALIPLLNLLWHPEQPTRAAALQALQTIGPDEKADVELLNRVSRIYVLVCAREETPPDEWSQWGRDALMDLQERLPALQVPHVVALSDLKRLRMGFHRFTPGERTFSGLITAFREWIEGQGGVISDWDKRFFHRELLDPPDLEEVDCVLVYYQP